jgi:hypothetical protein
MGFLTFLVPVDALPFELTSAVCPIYFGGTTWAYLCFSFSTGIDFAGHKLPVPWTD